MRITKVKLAGFKSFVDPTTLYLPGNLTGVVGPNGCGKSNIIDAMMWVMGESSAKHLRGDSMADVIFSGSGSRKPVGQAAVEIVFDNADGALGGVYAGFAEISIKRTVTRDGISNYFLNGARCRRKDIVDVFLGTGLGARGGYSVIEQGMISRVIEAKPDELRGFLEEAAGISKYRERRRETENRIRHTNENLARVNDVREELARQLVHLQRQAKVAEKYQEMKREERQLEAELLALRWQDVEAERARHVQAIAERDTALEAARAEVARGEALHAEWRARQVQAAEQFNTCQAGFYARSGEVARLEQARQHDDERRRALDAEGARTAQSLEETTRQHDEDLARQSTLTAELAALAPQEEGARVAEEEAAESLRRVEQRAEAWQQAWDVHNRALAEATRLEHAAQIRIELLQAGLADTERRIAALGAEREGLGTALAATDLPTLEAALEVQSARHLALQEDLQRQRTALAEAKQALEGETRQLHQLRTRLQQLTGEEASLSALQDAALGRDQQALRHWLERHALADGGLLAGDLAIAPGWELAVEVALRVPLSALCRDDIVGRLAGLPHQDLPVARLGGVDATPVATVTRAGMPPQLSDLVQSHWPLASLLAGVHAVETCEEALALRESLHPHESLVTREGVCVGPNWIALPGQETMEAGVLARQRHLDDTRETRRRLGGEVDALEAALQVNRDSLAAAELRERNTANSVQASHAAMTQARAQFTLRQDERTRHQQRLEAMTRELASLETQRAAADGSITILLAERAEHQARLVTLAVDGDRLARERREAQAELEAVRAHWRTARDTRHATALKGEGLRSTHGSVGIALARNARLVREMTERRSQLLASIAAQVAPRAALATELEAALQARLALEEALRACRVTLQSADAGLREAEVGQAAAARELAQRREALEAARLEERALAVRSQEVDARLRQLGHEPATLAASLAEGADEQGWKERLDALGNRLTRLGPINLAAIDEFAQLGERKTYLDNQCNDLTEALSTLDEAMRKIDKETRTRFKETFDKVNSGLQAMFPVLFGGGHAYLELTGDDLLETGVAVMARPPGKRNSTIHLLSGGEKALTALAFVFSLFELNPAPFCLLDEVDAPLDDANVVRLTELLGRMSERIQFLFVTHNKITMEIAQQLIGVTMHEAGVSRLVAVNMDEAVALATTA